jgi:hypothetical protein
MEKAHGMPFRQMTQWVASKEPLPPRAKSNKVFKMTVGILQTLYGVGIEGSHIQVAIPHRQLTEPTTRSLDLTQLFARAVSPTEKTGFWPTLARF